MHRNTKSNPCDRTLHPNESLVADAGFDEIELACLDISRLYFSTFAEPGGQSWMRAIDRAEYVFDHQSGASIASLVLKVIQAIRRSRRSSFQFSNPDCAGCARILTEHERRLIVAISAMRRGRAERAQVELMMLCEGNDTQAVMMWLTELKLALPKVGRRAMVM
ncbi:MAG: hypothetical protein AAF601_06065 [Pseudomonadota bacterium]